MKKVTKSMESSVPDWGVLHLEFINGVMSAADLALTHGISKVALSGRISRGKWVAERQTLAKSVTDVVQASMTRNRREELAEFNSNDLKVARALRGMVAALISKAQAAGAPPLSAKEMKLLSGTAADAQKIGRLALGASTDNHGIGGPGGEGPVAVANVSVAAYLEARKQVLQDF